MCNSYINLHISHCSTHRHTHTHTTILQLSGFCMGRPRSAGRRITFTHSHLSWSSVHPYLLPPSTTIHGILSVQFMCLTVFFHNLSLIFFGLSLRPAPSTSYSLHFFTQSLSSFRSTCPYHHNLFCNSTETVIKSQSLFQPITWNSIL